MYSYARRAEQEDYLALGGYSSGYDICTAATYCAKFVRAVGAAGGVDWSWNTLYGIGNIYDIENEYETKRIEIK